MKYLSIKYHMKRIPEGKELYAPSVIYLSLSAPDKLPFTVIDKIWFGKFVGVGLLWGASPNFYKFNAGRFCRFNAL